MKRSDPYAQMGLQWGDGATLAEIKEAYHIKSMELHPDRNRNDNAQVAARKFQDLQKAYQTLISVHSNLNGVSQEKDDEWRVSIGGMGIALLSIGPTLLECTKRDRLPRLLYLELMAFWAIPMDGEQVIAVDPRNTWTVVMKETTRKEHGVAVWEGV